MREIKTHQAHDQDNAVRLFALGEPDKGGAAVLYDAYVRRLPGEEASLAARLRFQDQPLPLGANGLTDEALLAVVMDRLEGFQKGPFPCDDNAKALKYLGFALKALHARTKDRRARGVEGEYKP